jgi:hypothetical protein
MTVEVVPLLELGESPAVQGAEVASEANLSLPVAVEPGKLDLPFIRGRSWGSVLEGAEHREDLNDLVTLLSAKTVPVYVLDQRPVSALVSGLDRLSRLLVVVGLVRDEALENLVLIR